MWIIGLYTLSSGVTVVESMDVYWLRYLFSSAYTCEQLPSGEFSITGLSSSHLIEQKKVNLTDSINSLIGKCSGTEYFAVHAWAHELVFISSISKRPYNNMNTYMYILHNTSFIFHSAVVCICNKYVHVITCYYTGQVQIDLHVP